MLKEKIKEILEDKDDKYFSEWNKKLGFPNSLVKSFSDYQVLLILQAVEEDKKGKHSYCDDIRCHHSFLCCSCEKCSKLRKENEKEVSNCFHKKGWEEYRGHKFCKECGDIKIEALCGAIGCIRYLKPRGKICIEK